MHQPGLTSYIISSVFSRRASSPTKPKESPPQLATVFLQPLHLISPVVRHLQLNQRSRRHNQPPVRLAITFSFSSLWLFVYADYSYFFICFFIWVLSIFLFFDLFFYFDFVHFPVLFQFLLIIILLYMMSFSFYGRSTSRFMFLEDASL